MINVLDHVQDANLCMLKAIDITKKGGYLLVGQDLTNEEDMHYLKDSPGATGHPIELSGEWMNEYFQGKFNPIINNILERSKGRSDLHYGTYIFAGKKTN